MRTVRKASEKEADAFRLEAERAGLEVIEVEKTIRRTWSQTSVKFPNPQQTPVRELEIEFSTDACGPHRWNAGRTTTRYTWLWAVKPGFKVDYFYHS